MTGKLIVIEGLDGAGKSTQIELLKAAFEKQGIKYKYVHFPMLSKGVYGELIAEFLRGEYGSVENVHPKLVALLFANDRKEHIDKIINWLEDGHIVLADRYVNSNIAFQCAKTQDINQKEKLKKWILNFEYNYNKLPKPFKSFFLNVSFDCIVKSLSKNRTGADRDYLKGKQDIHEKSLSLQEQVYSEYKKMIQEQSNFINIDCCDDNNNLLEPKIINGLIMNEISF
ncbi:MAG: dTMP kinase [Prevotellaceae bacterium]|jgi:dTMP kinase|nr:dTMP kinase [Prevotellaceae bacterium]